METLTAPAPSPALDPAEAKRAVTRVMSRWLSPTDCPPDGVLHAADCAFGYHFRDGLSPEAAARKAVTKNLNYEILKCEWCGEEFLSQMGQAFCCHHCWVQDRQFRDPGTEICGCGDNCDACQGDEKQRRKDWGGLLNLGVAVEENALSEVELCHLLRLVRGEGVANDMEEEEILVELVDRLGADRANLLVGHSVAILDILDAIEQNGYTIRDAIQDFMDGKDI